MTPLIVALDFPSASPAFELVQQLDPKKCRLKVGKELFTSAGPEFVARIIDQGFDVFLDLKFHDIPSTVAKAVNAAAELGVWMVNVHATGGPDMIAAAREVLEGRSGRIPTLIAVTVLTSTSPEVLRIMGVSRSLEEQVLLLARIAKESGADGVVCSALEAGQIKRECGESFATVTPGIRPAGSELDDQHRVMTPAEAVAAGSDYLVVGRPITKAAEPMAVVTDILDHLSSA